MASYGSTSLELSQDPSGVLAASQDDGEEVSVMLANALRKMDGLIGDYRYALLANQPLTSVHAQHALEACLLSTSCRSTRRAPQV